LNTSKHFLSINSGHKELSLSLGIVVFSNIYSINSANLDFQISFVFLSHHAERLTQVNTTSFHQDFSYSNISSTISSLSLK
jgi:hypothetical protein